MSSSTKKVGAFGAVASEPAGKKAKAPKAKFPTKAAMKKMSAEKRGYWERRIADSAMPNWWNNPATVQMRAGRVKAKDPVPMTRQVRRQKERREFCQPLNVLGAEWESKIKADRKTARMEAA